MKEKHESCLYEKTVEEECYCKLTWMPCKDFKECPEEVERNDDKRSDS